MGPKKDQARGPKKLIDLLMGEVSAATENYLGRVADLEQYVRCDGHWANHQTPVLRVGDCHQQQRGAHGPGC